MKHLILVVLLVLFSQFSSGQRPSDLELWTGGEVGFKLSKKFSGSIAGEVRFNDTLTALKKSLTEFGAQYKLGKRFSLKGMYRVTLPPNQPAQHRLTIDANCGWKEKGRPLSVKYRLRYQHVLGGNKTYIRNKIKVDYNLSKLLDPSLAYELFFRLNGKNEFRVSRLTVGLDWKINKHLELTTYFRLQDDIFIKSPERQHIIGFLLAYDLDILKTTNRAGS